MYYLVDCNATSCTDKYGGMRFMYYMDTLPGPGQVQGPWADVYNTAITKRMSAWFGELARLGGKVDYILSDFEMGDHSTVYSWVRQPTADGSDPRTALLADPRWSVAPPEKTKGATQPAAHSTQATVHDYRTYHQRKGMARRIHTHTRTRTYSTPTLSACCPGAKAWLVGYRVLTRTHACAHTVRLRYQHVDVRSNIVGATWFSLKKAGTAAGAEHCRETLQCLL